VFRLEMIAVLAVPQNCSGQSEEVVGKHEGRDKDDFWMFHCPPWRISIEIVIVFASLSVHG
jgi:hypothetical protein